MTNRSQRIRTALALTGLCFAAPHPEVQVLGRDAAVVSFQWTETTVEAGGSTSHQAGAITLIYERRDGEWLGTRAHESLRPARSPARE